MKKIKLYILTILSIFLTCFISIPDLGTNINDYIKKEKIYKSFEIDSLKRNRLLKTTFDRTLILKMSDGTKWNISKVYSEYFDELKNKKNIGKKYSLYVLNETDFYPSQVEIENRVIYNIKTSNIWNYVIIFLTLILIYFCIIEFKNKKQTKPTQNE